MPKYNLIEYSKNYRNTRGSLWNYYRDESNNPLLNNDNPLTVNYISIKIMMMMMKIITEKKTKMLKLLHH